MINIWGAVKESSSPIYNDLPIIFTSPHSRYIFPTNEQKKNFLIYFSRTRKPKKIINLKENQINTLLLPFCFCLLCQTNCLRWKWKVFSEQIAIFVIFAIFFMFSWYSPILLFILFYTFILARKVSATKITQLFDCFCWQFVVGKEQNHWMIYNKKSSLESFRKLFGRNLLIIKYIYI